MKLNYRIVIFALAIIFGISFSLPSLTQSEDGKKITLGLDLQGGLHMLLGVKTEEATKSRIKSITASIKHFSDRNDILIDGLSFDENEIRFEVLDEDELFKFDEFFKDIEGIEVIKNNT
ncbi:Protein-export membrane protein SecD (TC 3.A.5.1.1) [hydrothermal vent metagenome]|uniref:Protein-export membrane protein SecD (TC 3.A.5.1.1) n=1 Tax=hydrothermal vent metagenome TaxID=652676 RepID=A0A1W1CQT2_9ZZZZ